MVGVPRVPKPAPCAVCGELVRQLGVDGFWYLSGDQVHEGECFLTFSQHWREPAARLAAEDLGPDHPRSDASFAAQFDGGIWYQHIVAFAFYAVGITVGIEKPRLRSKGEGAAARAGRFPDSPDLMLPRSGRTIEVKSKRGKDGKPLSFESFPYRDLLVMEQKEAEKIVASRAEPPLAVVFISQYDLSMRAISWSPDRWLVRMANEGARQFPAYHAPLSELRTMDRLLARARQVEERAIMLDEGPGRASNPVAAEFDSPVERHHQAGPGP